MEIHSAVLEAFHAYRRTDRMVLISARKGCERPQRWRKRFNDEK
jgi:hypothetical protein